MAAFSGDDVACIIKHYEAVPESIDALGGFHPVFKSIWVNFIVDRRRKDVDENALWQEMLRLRKLGLLPRKKRVARKTIVRNPKPKEDEDDTQPD